MQSKYASIGIVIVCVLMLAGIYALHKKPAPEEVVAQPPEQQQEAVPVLPSEQQTATSSEPIHPVTLPEIIVSKTDFQYDIHIGKTACNETIGSFEVTSTDPSQALDWTLVGTKPIWLTFSAVEGKTPATVDMTYNCILSGLEDAIDWSFAVVETAFNKDKPNAGTYTRNITLKGAIIKE